MGKIQAFGMALRGTAGDASMGLEKGTVLEGAGVVMLEEVAKVISGKAASDELGATSEVGVGQ